LNEDSGYSGISIFDLDKTLLVSNSSYHFGSYLYKNGDVTTRNVLELIWNYWRHHKGNVSMFELHQCAFNMLFSGQQSTEINEHVTNFLELHLDKLIRRSILELLQKAQSGGEYTIILSSSPDFIVSKVAGALNVSEYKGTEYLIGRDGSFAQVGSIFCGRSKARYVEQLVKRLGVSEKRVTGYSDSFSDLPLLEVVGNPVAVCPDAKLKKHCQLHEWPIIL